MEEMLTDNSSFHFMLVGFIGQMIDGGLGMAYGVSANSVLPPLAFHLKLASASPRRGGRYHGHIGLSHFQVGNGQAPGLRLILPGVVGGVIGATADAGQRRYDRSPSSPSICSSWAR